MRPTVNGIRDMPQNEAVKKAKAKYRAAHREQINERERAQVKERAYKRKPRNTPEDRARNNDRQKRYRERHKQKVMAKARERANALYRSLSPEQKAKRQEATTAANRKWREENREKSRAYFKEWEKTRNRVITPEEKKRWNENAKRRYQENPEPFREYGRVAGAKRRALKRSVTVEKITKEQIDELFLKQGKKCATCKTRITKHGARKFEIDHVVPLKLGGEHSLKNTCLLCLKCNRSKAAKHPDDWAKKHGLLFI